MINCEAEFFGNELFWTIIETDSCTSADIATFELFSMAPNDTGFVLIEDDILTSERNFLDVDGNQLWSYFITATDSSGNTSVPSNIVIQDFCGEIEFPNIFTPNGDGRNDGFAPTTSLSGFQDITFTVYNRLGKQIFFINDAAGFPWDGIGDNGNESSDGVYFVYFTANRIANVEESVTYRGWVQILR